MGTDGCQANRVDGNIVVSACGLILIAHAAGQMVHMVSFVVI